MIFELILFAKICLGKDLYEADENFISQRNIKYFKKIEEKKQNI